MFEEFLSEKEKKDIFNKIINKVGANNMQCPMCGNRGFSVADGYFTDLLQSGVGSSRYNKKSLITVGTICSKCGFVSKFVLGALNNSSKRE